MGLGDGSAPNRGQAITLNNVEQKQISSEHSPSICLQQIWNEIEQLERLRSEIALPPHDYPY